LNFNAINPLKADGIYFIINASTFENALSFSCKISTTNTFALYPVGLN